MNPVAGGKHCAADPAQLGAGIIRNFFLRKNAAADFTGKMRQRNQTVKKVIEHAVLIFLCRAVFAHPGYVFEKRSQAQQLRHGEAGFHRERTKQIRKIAIASEGNPSGAQKARRGRFGLILSPLDFTQIIHRKQIAAQCPTGVRGRFRLKKTDDFIKFYNSEYFFIHDIRSISHSQPDSDGEREFRSFFAFFARSAKDTPEMQSMFKKPGKYDKI